jgi:hypothetical protein
MRRLEQAVIVRGVIGGIIAGLVVALWFLVVDVIAGRPFHTPAALAGVVLNRASPQPTLQLVAVYTVLHFGVFALFGVAMAYLSGAFRAPPRLLQGVVFGLLLQEAVFYTGLVLSRAPDFAVVPWLHVIGANVAAGLVLMGYLHRAEHDPRPLLPSLHNHPLLARGAITGLIGALVVAVWFFLLDVAGGTPFRTPAALGSALLLGGSSPAGVEVSVGLVAAYTVVHVGAFLIAGVVFVALAEQVERVPAMALLVLLTAILLEGLFLATLAVGAEWVLGTLGWWSVAIANMLAVSAMSWQVWRTHPTLQRRVLQEHPDLRV